jgi:hypothetical protein
VSDTKQQAKRQFRQCLSNNGAHEANDGVRSLTGVSEAGFPVVSPHPMLSTPLDCLCSLCCLLLGFDIRRQQNVQRKTNMDRFKDHFGSDPVVHAQIWEDLQTSENEDLSISRKASADSFLQGMHFLKCHPKEEERSGLFKMCKTAARNWGWRFAEKVQALKEEKVSLKQFAADAPPKDNY